MLSGTLSKKDLFEVDPPLSYTGSNAESPEMTILIRNDNKIALDDKIIPLNNLEAYLTSLLKDKGVSKSDKSIDVEFNDLTKRYPKLEANVIGINRNDKFFIPKKTDTVKKVSSFKKKKNFWRMENVGSRK